MEGNLENRALNRIVAVQERDATMLNSNTEAGSIKIRRSLADG
jgi:hypothetical protein